MAQRSQLVVADPIAPVPPSALKLLDERRGSCPYGSYYPGKGDRAHHASHDGVRHAERDDYDINFFHPVV
jgi:hypothetical protein